MASSRRKRFGLPLMTEAELENPPSCVFDGMSKVREEQERVSAARMLVTIGFKYVKMSKSAVFASAVYFHWFYHRHRFKVHKSWVVACACLFLAGKTEESRKKLDDLLEHFLFQYFQKKLGQRDRPKKGSTDFKRFREKVLDMEHRVMVALEFNFVSDNPYSHVLDIFKELYPNHSQNRDQQRLFKDAWYFVNTSLGGSLCLTHPPRQIALGAVYAAHVTAPHVEKRGALERSRQAVVQKAAEIQMSLAELCRVSDKIRSIVTYNGRKITVGEKRHLDSLKEGSAEKARVLEMYQKTTIEERKRRVKPTKIKTTALERQQLRSLPPHSEEKKQKLRWYQCTTIAERDHLRKLTGKKDYYVYKKWYMNTTIHEREHCMTLSPEEQIEFKELVRLTKKPEREAYARMSPSKKKEAMRRYRKRKLERRRSKDFGLAETLPQPAASSSNVSMAQAPPTPAKPTPANKPTGAAADMAVDNGSNGVGDAKEPTRPRPAKRSRINGAKDVDEQDGSLPQATGPRRKRLRPSPTLRGSSALFPSKSCPSLSELQTMAIDDTAELTRFTEKVPRHEAGKAPGKTTDAAAKVEKSNADGSSTVSGGDRGGGGPAAPATDPPMDDGKRVSEATGSTDAQSATNRGSDGEKSRLDNGKGEGQPTPLNPQSITGV